MRIFLLLIIVSLPLTCYAKTIRTKSYVRKNGTYVNSANKTSPNKTKIDNYAYRDWETDRKSTRLNSSHRSLSRMPSSA